MSLVTIDLDAGELPHEPEALLAAADRIHIACGGHAGDEASMRRTVRVAQAHGVEVGAHPSYPDRARFGRVSLALPAAEVAAAVAAQCGALLAVARSLGVRVVSAKPHGALYHDVARDRGLAAAVLDAIVDTLGPVELVTIPGALADLARGRGLVVQREGFADRGLRPDGSLVPRGEAGAMIEDPGAAAVQARRLAASGTVDTLCVHGDGTNPLAIVRAVRRALAA
ncbi:MAG TPA: LamB/YcsF family protein [Kofleriaceae bacterium]|nr:LamB/YcsF family protein [Kofleriaceae bacterium]